MTDQIATRQDHLDSAHGMMILYVMFFHLCASIIHNPNTSYLVLHPLSFFVAWFFFKSGMFYKEQKVSLGILNGLKKLIVPYAVFSIIGFAVFCIVKHPTIDWSFEWNILYLFGSLLSNMPLWFLLSLFVVQVFYNLLRKCHLSPLSIVLVALGLYYINRLIGFRPYWTYNIPLGLLFYTLGQVFKDLQYKHSVIITCIIVYIGLYLIHTNIDFVIAKFKPEIVAIPWSLAGCMLLNAIFKAIPCFSIKPLMFFSRHAMEFYCTHIIILDTCEHITEHSNLVIPDAAFKIVVFVAYIVVFSLILYFFKLYYIQWMFGRSIPKKQTIV